MTKQECRKIFRQKRKELTGLEILKLDDLLLIQFQKLDMPFVSIVHTYLSLEKENEIDTSAFTRYLQFKNPGMILAVPKINFDTEEFHQVIFDESSDLVLNRHGIEEPSEDRLIDPEATDLVFVPLLAFDRQGYRVGFGKGFYDKFLSHCRKDVIKIGLSYFDAIDEITDINQYDIPLNYCITPERIYEF